MVSVNARRAFLFGRAPAEPVVRPPWSLPEADFLDRCTRCDACVKACPTHIIKVGDGGFPFIDFSQGECTFCQSCVSACDASAFDAAQAAPWRLQLTLHDACLAKQAIFCMACVDACPEQAIRLHYASSVPTPEVDASRCTGCGGCIAICPSQAISLSPVQTDDSHA
jgi:ferredoxin-type protein NapF